MDNGLVLIPLAPSSLAEGVLILIVVEDGLVLTLVAQGCRPIVASLNPCCSGRWSRTKEDINDKVEATMS